MLKNRSSSRRKKKKQSSKLLNVDVVVVEGLDCCFLSPENIKKTHVVVRGSRGLHEWINTNCSLRCLTVLLWFSLECWSLHKWEKKKNSTFNSFLSTVFCFFSVILFDDCSACWDCKLNKCCLLLPWRTTEIKLYNHGGDDVNAAAFFLSFFLSGLKSLRHLCACVWRQTGQWESKQEKAV